MNYLSHQGIVHVLLSIGYLASQIRAFAGSGRRWRVQVTYSEEQEPLGTGGALRLASEKLESKAFFALNGDTLFQIGLSRLWGAHCKFQSSGRAATLALRQVRSPEWKERGCVTLSKDGRILSFAEKPGSRQDLSPGNLSPGSAAPQETLLVNGGVYVFQKNALDSIPIGSEASLEHDVFPRLAHKGQIAGLVQEGYFADIGTPESLAAFQNDVIQGKVRFEGALDPSWPEEPPEK
jgi:NDP-sugar pyrophosphorylase family protein